MKVNKEVWQRTIGKIRHVQHQISGLGCYLTLPELEAIWSTSHKAVYASARLEARYLRAQVNGEPYQCRRCQARAKVFQQKLCKACLIKEFQDTSIPLINNNRDSKTKRGKDNDIKQTKVA